jgi:hypothetical protein
MVLVTAIIEISSIACIEIVPHHHQSKAFILVLGVGKLAVFAWEPASPGTFFPSFLHGFREVWEAAAGDEQAQGCPGSRTLQSVVIDLASHQPTSSRQQHNWRRFDVGTM